MNMQTFDWRIERPANIILQNDITSGVNEAATIILNLAQMFIKTKKCFTVVLGGGRTPIHLNKSIIQNSIHFDIEWNKVHFFFCDERCVPPHHPDSNFGMMYRTLFKPLGISDCNIYRIKGEISAISAANEYERVIRKYFKETLHGPDLSIMGIGKDGHTASLFPKQSEYFTERLVINAGKGPDGHFRVSMTPKFINRSNNILFVIFGTEKEIIAKKLISGSWDPENCPAQLINPNSGMLYYVVDKSLIN